MSIVLPRVLITAVTMNAFAVTVSQLLPRFFLRRLICQQKSCSLPEGLELHWPGKSFHDDEDGENVVLAPKMFLNQDQRAVLSLEPINPRGAIRSLAPHAVLVGRNPRMSSPKRAPNMEALYPP